MNYPKRNPIIFIPGLMGSLGGEMLGCKIEWGFGMAAWFYKPFIDELEKLGYTLNEDLFICYYDWRKSCKEIVKEFLIPLIRKVKKKFPNKKIDLLCHSMGGIVARTYIQDAAYLYNVRNLMLFAAPNKGNIEAYYIWSIGKMMKKPNKEKDIYDIVRSGYIWILSKLLDIPLKAENMDKLHKNFKGLCDLIPTYDYGETLCYQSHNDYIYIPRKYDVYHNPLLNDLNRDINILNKRVENLYCFIGTKNETDKALIVDKDLLIKEKKGYVIGSLKTMKGDGTVTVDSATIDNAKKFIIEDSHSGILKKSINYIADIYNLDQSLIKTNTKEQKEYPFGIILKKHMNIELKSETSFICKFVNGEFTTEYDYMFQEFDKNYLWMMFKNIPRNKYTLEANINNKEDDHIFVIGNLIEKELVENNLQSTSINTIKYSFNI